MTEAENEDKNGTGIVEQVVSDPIPPEPAPGAEEQKPIPAATDENAEVVETPEQQEAHKQSKFQRRLDRQKSARVAAETETRLLREQLAKLEAQSKPAGPAEPQLDQFETLADYNRAVAKHEAQQIVDKALKADHETRSQQENQSRVTASEGQIAKDWQEREAAFQAQNKDYQDVVMSLVDDGEIASLSEVARRSILESEVGPQVLYHLARNPEDAERIAELSPARQVAELGKLELKMSPVVRKTSAAPAPIKTVSQGRSAAQGYSDNWSDAEYREWRKGHGARWAR